MASAAFCISGFSAANSKHPPVNFSGLYDNFIAILVFHLPLSEPIVVVVNFGVCQSLWDRLSQEHFILEPTGAHNLAANGHVEQGIGVLCIQAQICLYASGLYVTFWCFAPSHAAMCCNFRRNFYLVIVARQQSFCLASSPMPAMNWNFNKP